MTLNITINSLRGPLAPMGIYTLDGWEKHFKVLQFQPKAGNCVTCVMVGLNEGSGITMSVIRFFSASLIPLLLFQSSVPAVVCNSLS